VASAAHSCPENSRFVATALIGQFSRLVDLLPKSIERSRKPLQRVNVKLSYDPAKDLNLGVKAIIYQTYLVYESR
jgi:hypothetical protein